MTTKSKNKDRGDSPTASLTVESGVVYPIKDFQKRTGLGEFAFRQAKRRGLRVHYVGNRGFVIGDDWIEFLQSPKPDQENA